MEELADVSKGERTSWFWEFHAPAVAGRAPNLAEHCYCGGCTGCGGGCVAGAS